jgi:hypothetical protein
VRKFVFIVALAVVAWVFVVPSCGAQFGCDSGSGALAAARAEGEEGCPADLEAAAQDAVWAAARAEELSGKPLTTGLLYRDGDTSGTEIESGTGSDHYDLALEYTTGLADVLDKPPGHQLAEHVEVQAAALMREDGEDLGVLVINHPGGPCRYASGIGCVNAVPLLLETGTKLVVWSPGGRQVVFDGRA